MTHDALHSSLELALTGLLRQQARSGYDLLKVFAETALGGFSSSPGAVYPALKRLVKAGIITGSVENRDTLRPRQVFRVTPAGVAALRERLRRPVQADDVRRDPGGVLLRFAFAGEVLGRKEAIRILEEYARECDAYVPELRAQYASLPEAADECGRLALAHGIAGFAADARWARKVIRELEQRAANRPGRSTSRKQRRNTTPKGDSTS